MRLPATWTRLMAVAIVGYASLLLATVFGGGWLAWILAMPAMFVGLQVLGLLVVMLCELADRVRLLPRTWRPMVDEILIVGCLTGLGFWVLPVSLVTAVALFFGCMYCLRAVARKAWRPGEAEEVEA